MYYIGTTGKTAITIGNKQYSLQQLAGKTLYAAKRVPVYKTYLNATPEYYIEPGNIVGIVQGFVAKGYKGSARDYFLIGPNTRDVKAAVYTANLYSETKLVQQGTKNTKEEIKDIADEITDEATPWYIKSLKTIMPYVLIGTIGYLLLTKRKQ